MKNLFLSLVFFIPAVATAQVETVSYKDQAGNTGYLQMETLTLKDSSYYTYADNKYFSVGLDMTAFLAKNKVSGVVYVFVKSKEMIMERPALTVEYGYASTPSYEPLSLKTKPFNALGKNGGDAFVYALNLSADPALATLLKCKNLFYIFYNPDAGIVSTSANTALFTSDIQSSYRPGIPSYFKEQLKGLLAIQK